MQEIIKFLFKRRFFLTFIIIEMISLSLIVKYNRSQNDIFWHNIGLVTNAMKDKKNSYLEYTKLKSINEEILEENAKLKAKIKSIEYFQDDHMELDDPEVLRKFDYKSATVIYNDLSSARNHIILNKGSEDGIRLRDAVVSQEGIVGVVSALSKNYSKVLSALNLDFRLSAGLKGKQHFGYLRWEPFDTKLLWMHGIPKHVEIELGDEIETKYSIIFPENYPIGVIEDYFVEQGSNYYSIRVRLHQDMSTLSQLYIVQNKEIQQIDTLEIPSIYE